MSTNSVDQQLGVAAAFLAAPGGDPALGRAPKGQPDMAIGDNDLEVHSHG